MHIILDRREEVVNLKGSVGLIVKINGCLKLGLIINVSVSDFLTMKLKQPKPKI